MNEDGDGYVLAFGGENARLMDEFIQSIGHYLLKKKTARGDTAEAKQEVVRAFEEWLSKQSV